MAVARDQLIDLGIGSGGPSLRLARYRDRVPANRVGAQMYPATTRTDIY